MSTNNSKINLANKICSTLFFIFAIINFVLSILVMVNITGDDKNQTSKYILNFGLTISAFASVGLNIYIVVGMFLTNKQAYKNAMFYLLSLICLFGIVSYIYCIVQINNNYTKTLTTEFWLLLIASGLSVLFGGWNCLINWNLLRELTFNSNSTEYTKCDEIAKENNEQASEIKTEDFEQIKENTNI